jgi:glutathione peroxidase
MTSTLYDFSVRDISGQPQEMGRYRGQVLLIVNVASQCGFTPQYEGLEALYRRLHPRGFAVLGFPCNQFGHQEPGTEDEIASFCHTRFSVTFPLFSKIEVNGDEADPLWKWLKAQAPGVLGSQAIKWNFTKFLVGRRGQVIERFAPTTSPKDLEPAIERALDERTDP